MAQAVARERTAGRTAPAVIDCDIHVAPASAAALRAFLPERWRGYHERFGSRGFTAGYPRVSPNAARHDAWPPTGGPPGSDLPFLREQLLDAWGIEYGILTPLLGATGGHLPEYEAALARAVNDWQIAEWLDPEPRLRASIVVPFEAGDLAAAEIDRLAGDRRFVQVLLTVRTMEPLGRRKYWPLYEAAARHGLPVGIHFGGDGGNPLTGSGWPSFYLEDHCGMAQTFQSQIISFVYEGVFERFPALKILLIEGGFAWLPPLLWRLDAAWRRQRDETPHLRRPPSEYVREHFWLTTQPMEEPSTPAQFQQLLDHLAMDDRLLFATDYPHWDFDAPDQALPARVAPDLTRRILAENARAFYGLE